MKVFLGTLWSSVKKNKAPYVSDWEQEIALHAMQGNRASSLGMGEASWFFWSCGGYVGYILEFQRGLPFKTRVCSATSGLLSTYDGHFRILNKAWKDNWTLLEVTQETMPPFQVGTVILGFLSFFKKCQASSPFEALNSAHLSRCLRDMRPHVQMWRRPRVFSRVSTGDSDIPFML